MSRDMKGRKEFRYYEKPGDEIVLTRAGKGWKRNYDNDFNNPHFHNLLEIGYCHYGMGCLLIDNQQYGYTNEMISIIPRNIIHATRSEGDSISYWEYIFIDPQQIIMEMYEKQVIASKNIIKNINKRGFIFLKEDNVKVANIIQNIIWEMSEKKLFYRESTRGLVYSLLIEIFRINMEYDEKNLAETKEGIRIENAIEYIDTYYSKTIKINELARVCHMSETHFRRVFGACMNVQPLEYINLVRIEVACDLIKKTNNSMEVVAEQVGFQSLSTFIKNFKKVVGTTPYQWKKSEKNYEVSPLDVKTVVLKGW